MKISLVIISSNQGWIHPLRWRALLPQIEARSDSLAEIIVVTEDGNRTVDLPGKVSVVVESSHRPGNRCANRNQGAKAATGDRIAFLDGDIIPGPAFLLAHLSGTPDSILLGPRRNLNPTLNHQVLTQYEGRAIDYDSFWEFADEREPHFKIAPIGQSPSPWRFFHSHNFSIDRQVFLEIGGFDEGMVHWGADDLELGKRLASRGFNFEWRPDCFGWHLWHPQSTRSGEYGKNLELFQEKHHDLDVQLLWIENKLTPRGAWHAFEAVRRFPPPIRRSSRPEGGAAGLFVSGDGIEGFQRLFISGDALKKYRLVILHPDLRELGPEAVRAISDWYSERGCEAVFAEEPGKIHGEPAKTFALAYPGMFHTKFRPQIFDALLSQFGAERISEDLDNLDPDRPPFGARIVSFPPPWAAIGNHYIRVFWEDIFSKTPEFAQSLVSKYDHLWARTRVDFDLLESRAPGRARYVPPMFPTTETATRPPRKKKAVLVVLPDLESCYDLQLIQEVSARCRSEFAFRVHVGARGDWLKGNAWLSSPHNEYKRIWSAFESDAREFWNRKGGFDVPFTVGPLGPEALASMIANADAVLSITNSFVCPWEILTAMSMDLPVVIPDHLGIYENLSGPGVFKARTIVASTGMLYFEPAPYWGNPIPRDWGRIVYRSDVDSVISMLERAMSYSSGNLEFSAEFNLRHRETAKREWLRILDGKE